MNAEERKEEGSVEEVILETMKGFWDDAMVVLKSSISDHFIIVFHRILPIDQCLNEVKIQKDEMVSTLESFIAHFTDSPTMDVYLFLSLLSGHDKKN